MSDSSTTSSTAYGILVGVDGSAESDAAVRWAAREAVLRHTPVTLVHVVEPVVVSWPIGPAQASIAEWQEQNAQDLIEQAQKTLLASVGDSEPPDVHTEVLYSGVIVALVDASKDAQLIVVGSRGMGAVGRMILGSVSSGLVHRAHCPVAVIHADEAQAPNPSSPVVVGIDGSPASEAATALAFDEASRLGVELVALHAWSDIGYAPIPGIDWQYLEEEGRETLAERLAGWQERYPDVHVRRRVVSDRPSRRLVDESEQAQLVVVGSHGRGGFTSMLVGSVGWAVAQAAKCPVIVVRSR